MSGLDVALAFTLRPDVEGGYVNNPQDPGGATDRGVTQRVYDAARTAQGFPTRDVRQMTPEECRAIYAERYWTPIKGDELPVPVAVVAFDAAVNQGEGYAPKLVQWAVGAVQDGKIGPATIAAVRTKPEADLVDDLIWARLQRYLATCRYRKTRGLEPYVFIDGWLGRLDKLRLYLRTAT